MRQTGRILRSGDLIGADGAAECAVNHQVVGRKAEAPAKRRKSRVLAGIFCVDLGNARNGDGFRAFHATVRPVALKSNDGCSELMVVAELDSAEDAPGIEAQRPIGRAGVIAGLNEGVDRRGLLGCVQMDAEVDAAPVVSGDRSRRLPAPLIEFIRARCRRGQQQQADKHGAVHNAGLRHPGRDLSVGMVRSKRKMCHMEFREVILVSTLKLIDFV